MLLSLAGACRLREMARDRSIVVGTTNGVWELLHPGHIGFLEECRKQCGLLFVLVNSDRSARRMRKGAGRPVTTEQERARLVGALKPVAVTCIFNEADPAQALALLRPDKHFKDEEYRNKGIPEAPVVEAGGGQMVYVKRTEESTTGLIQRIQHLLSSE